jgi:hypothetical protein
VAVLHESETVDNTLFKAGWNGWVLVWMCAKCKKPWFEKSEMHGGLPFKKGTVVSASKRRRGAPKNKTKRR